MQPNVVLPDAAVTLRKIRIVMEASVGPNVVARSLTDAAVTLRRIRTLVEATFNLTYIVLSDAPVTFLLDSFMLFLRCRC